MSLQPLWSLNSLQDLAEGLRVNDVTKRSPDSKVMMFSQMSHDQTSYRVIVGLELELQKFLLERFRV